MICFVFKWFVSQTPYLIHEHTKAPHITGRGVLLVVKCLLNILLYILQAMANWYIATIYQAWKEISCTKIMKLNLSVQFTQAVILSEFGPSKGLNLLYIAPLFVQYSTVSTQCTPCNSWVNRIPLSRGVILYMYVWGYYRYIITSGAVHRIGIMPPCDT